MKKKIACAISVAVGLIHLVLLIAFYLHMQSDKAERSQIVFLWIFWSLIDMPISLLLLVKDFFQTLKSILMTQDSNMVYLFFHGFFGTMWWMLLAYFFCLFINWLVGKVQLLVKVFFHDRF